MMYQGQARNRINWFRGLASRVKATACDPDLWLAVAFVALVALGSVA